MRKLKVFDNGTLVGYGFVILYPDGKMSAPELFYTNGEKLLMGWFQLMMTDQDWNVVVPENVQ